MQINDLGQFNIMAILRTVLQLIDY